MATINYKWLSTDSSQDTYYQVSGDGIDIFQKVRADGSIDGGSYHDNAAWFQVFVKDDSITPNTTIALNNCSMQALDADGNVITSGQITPGSTNITFNDASHGTIPSSIQVSPSWDWNKTINLDRMAGHHVDANSTVNIQNKSGQVQNTPVVINGNFPTDGEKVTRVTVDFTQHSDGVATYPNATATANITLSDGRTFNHVALVVDNGAHDGSYVRILTTPDLSSLDNTAGVSIKSIELTVNPGGDGWYQGVQFNVRANGQLYNRYDDGSRVKNGDTFPFTWTNGTNTMTDTIKAKTQDVEKPALRLNDVYSWVRDANGNYSGQLKIFSSSWSNHLTMQSPSYYVVLPSWVELDQNTPVVIHNYDSSSNVDIPVTNYQIQHHGLWNLLIISEPGYHVDIDDSEPIWNDYKQNAINDGIPSSDYDNHHQMTAQSVTIKFHNNNYSLSDDSHIVWGVADQSFTPDNVTFYFAGDTNHETPRASNLNQTTDSEIKQEMQIANSAMQANGINLDNTNAYKAEPINLRVADGFYGNTDFANQNGQIESHATTSSDTGTMYMAVINAVDNDQHNVNIRINVPNTSDGVSQFNPTMTGPVTMTNATTHEAYTPTAVTYDVDGESSSLTADQVTANHEWAKVTAVHIHLDTLPGDTSLMADLPLAYGVNHDAVLANNGKSIYANALIYADEHGHQRLFQRIAPGDTASAQLTIHITTDHKAVTRTINVGPAGTTPGFTIHQTANLTRTATFDEATNSYVWGDWTTGNWEAYTVPTVAGYTPSQTSVPAESVNGTTADQVVNITYTKNETPIPKSTVTVNFIDQASGDVIKNESYSGQPGSTVTLNLTLPAGYQLAAGQTLPSNTYTFTSQNDTIKIYLTQNQNTEPTHPTSPTTPTNPTSPTNPTTPTSPTNPITPTSPTSPTNPTTPTEPTQPTQPTSPTKPTQPKGQDSETPQPTEPTQPTSPTSPVNPNQPTTPNQPVTPVQPVQPKGEDQSGHTPAAQAVQPVNVNHNEATAQSKPASRLPQTGNQHGLAAVLGLVGVTLAGWLGLADKKREN